MSRWIGVFAGTGIIIILLYGVFVAGRFFTAQPGPDTVVCTADAMQCSDGSYVGRSGPRCEFVCPQASSTPQNSKETVETSIGKSVHVLGIDILPLQVTQDSRCPIGVECIWAGTVELKGSVHSAMGTSQVVFKLGTPVTTEAESITLVSVTPAPHQGVTIAASDYLFVFEVTKR